MSPKSIVTVPTGSSRTPVMSRGGVAVPVVTVPVVTVSAVPAPAVPAAGIRPRAAASNSARRGPDRPSASASSRAVSLRAVRLIPRSRSLIDRGLRPAACASSSCVSPASSRSCRSSFPNRGAACSAIGLTVPHQPGPPPAPGAAR